MSLYSFQSDQNKNTDELNIDKDPQSFIHEYNAGKGVNCVIIQENDLEVPKNKLFNYQAVQKLHFEEIDPREMIMYVCIKTYTQMFLAGFCFF